MLVMGRCIEVLRFVGAEDHHLSALKTSVSMPPGPDVLLASMTTQQTRAEVGQRRRGEKRRGEMEYKEEEEEEKRELGQEGGGGGGCG